MSGVGSACARSPVATTAARDKPIRLSRHASDYRARRGFTEAEVIAAIPGADSLPAREHRLEAPIDVPFDGERKGRRYARKRVRAIFWETTVTTRELAAGIVAEHDAREELVGLEILDAGSRLDEPSVLREVILEGLSWVAAYADEDDEARGSRGVIDLAIARCATC